MRDFHNALIALIDESPLTPAEVLVVFDMMEHRVHQLLELQKTVG